MNLQLVPAHYRISGNEAADKAAKSASEERVITNTIKPFLNDHNALLRQRLEEHLREKWKEESRETYLGNHKKEWEK